MPYKGYKTIVISLELEEWFECKNCKHRLLVLNNETEAIHLEGGTKCLSPDEKQENLCKCVKPEFDLLLPILKAGVSKGAN